MRYSIANVFTGGQAPGCAGSAHSRHLPKVRFCSASGSPVRCWRSCWGVRCRCPAYLLQVFFRNPIAGPFEAGDLLGCQNGGGGDPDLSQPVSWAAPDRVTLILAAFIGSLFITGIVLLFSQKVNNMSTAACDRDHGGVYLQRSQLGNGVTFADDHDIVNLTNWSMGSFSGASWEQVRTAALLCLAGLLCAPAPSLPPKKTPWTSLSG